MELRPESTLHSVVVYASGALCRRRITVELPPGEESPRLRVTGLPLVLDPHSLRAQVLSGPPGLRVRDVRHSVEAELAAPEQLPRLRRDLDAAEVALDAVRARRERLAARIEDAAGLRAVPPVPRRGDPPRPAPVGALLALAAFVDGRLAGLQRQLIDVEDELEHAEHAADLARLRLEEASRALPTGTTRTTSAVLLTLSRQEPEPEPGADGTPEKTGAEAEAEAELELEYGVAGATWTPTYQLRLSGMAGGDPGGDLTMRACVAQRTGEDWNGVRLSLSTARPGRRTDRPELRSLRIGRRQDEPSVAATREPPTGLGELFSGYDARLRPETLARPGAGGGLIPGARPGLPARPGAPAPVPASAPAPAPAGSAGPGEQAKKARSRAPLPPPMASQDARLPLAPPPPPPSPSLSPASASYGAAFGAAPGPSVTPAPEAVVRDYAGLILAGPTAPPGERGTLVTPDQDRAGAAAADERRRRSMEIAGLGLPAHSVPVRRSAGSFDYRYDTAAPVDVPADGAWHTVPVREFAVGITSEYVCVPAADPRVYAAVHLANTGDSALLAGAAEVTVDGEYLMTVGLPVLAPGQRRRVGIGVAESIQVARRVRTGESSAGLRGGTTVVEQRVEIELANRLDRPVTVEVRERVPVSDDKDIRIEDSPSTPPWTVVPSEQGGEGDGDEDAGLRGRRLWRVRLEPRATTVLTGGHDLRIPAGKAVVGGNRRG